MPATEWHAPTRDPIRERTSDASNLRIDRTTRGAIDELPALPAAVRVRLAQLDREWSVDRAVMLTFAILGGISATKALRGSIGWGLILRAQLAFLGYHAVKRWCPPLPVLRRLGFRSDHEIAAERVALEKRLAVLNARGA
jgi:hypothetical protein